MKKPSLRVKLTLITVGIILAIAVSLTYISMNGASTLAIGVASLNGDTLVGQSTGPEDWRAQSLDSVSEAGDFAYPPNVSGGQLVYAINQFNVSSIIYMLVIVGIGGICTYFVLGRALRPLKKLGDEISGIGEKKLHTRVTAFESGDEVNALACAFNSMLNRLEKAFTAQKGFALAAAHELKTPLTAIKANIDIYGAKETACVDRYKKIVDVTKKQTNRMIGLVDDLFALANLQEYDFAEGICIYTVLADIAADLEALAQSGGLALSLGNKEDARVSANASMLRRAFTNIIENAIKYNKPGGKIEISVGKSDGYVTVTVADGGIGIEESHLRHLFEPFYRADQSRSRNAGGAGLGLAITKEIIDRHSGDIAISSVYGQGTTVVVKLPIQ